jgi:hypothetical protein
MMVIDAYDINQMLVQTPIQRRLVTLLSSININGYLDDIVNASR